MQAEILMPIKKGKKINEMGCRKKKKKLEKFLQCNKYFLPTDIGDISYLYFHMIRMARKCKKI